MAPYAAMIEAECISHPAEVDDYDTSSLIAIGGELVKVKQHKQRNGKDMAFLGIRWNEEDFDVVAFADSWEANRAMLQETGVPVVCEAIKLPGKGCLLSQVIRLDWMCEESKTGE